MHLNRVHKDIDNSSSCESGRAVITTVQSAFYFTPCMVYA